MPRAESGRGHNDQVRNEITARVSGNVVQAGTIISAVHLPPPGPVRPRQLPAAPGSFTGRAAELAALDASSSSASTVKISAICGTGGIGKTSLALRWAYQHLDGFPDGQLFVDLHGFDPNSEPMAPAAATRAFLDALGVAPSSIPSEPEAQTGLYRSLVAGRRMLIVLDNARDADQVISLLPGSPSCTVLVTSRRQLPGLVTAHDAHALSLNVLTHTESERLFAHAVDPARITAEPEAVAELLTLCAGLPLALTIVAARAAAHPTFPLAALAQDLRDARLDTLDGGDLNANLRAVFFWSYQALSTETATVFGLVGLAPGPDLSLLAAIPLADLSAEDTRRHLSRLEQAHLVQEHLPGRYRMHDLVRLYAAEQAHHDLHSDDRMKALRRVVDFYTRTGHIADRMLDSRRSRIQIALPDTNRHLHRPRDTAAAQTWFNAEYPCLLTSQQLAAKFGWHTNAWALAWALTTFHRWRGNLHGDFAVWQVGLKAAYHLGEPTAQTEARRRFGLAHARFGRHAPALHHLHKALALAEDSGDIEGQADTHMALGWLWGHWRKDSRALEHAGHALRLYRHNGQPVGDALNAIGYYHARQGRHAHARLYCETSLALLRHSQDHEGEACTLDALGYIAFSVGSHAEAVGYYRQAISLFHRIGNAYEEANSLDRLGQAYLALGSHATARHAWQRALELYHTQLRTADAERVHHRLGRLLRQETIKAQSFDDPSHIPHHGGT